MQPLVNACIVSTGLGHNAEESYESVLDPVLASLKQEGLNFERTIVYLPLKWCGHIHKRALNHYLDSSSDEYPHLVAQYHAPQTQEVFNFIVSPV